MDRILTLVQARVRKLLDTMLDMRDWTNAAAQYPPLTDEEIKSVASKEGRLTCTAANFRIDFDHKWKKFPFNEMARDVFITNFLATAASGAFIMNPTPPHLLTREVIGKVLDKRMKHCRLLYRRSLNPRTSEEAKKVSRRNCKGMRKNTVSMLVRLANPTLTLRGRSSCNPVGVQLFAGN